MKTNKAPEKVYLLFNRPYLVDYAKLNKRRCEEEVEYTRTDAFIEKACEGIDHLLSGYVIRNFHFRDSYDVDRFIEDFKCYMKGE